MAAENLVVKTTRQKQGTAPNSSVVSQEGIVTSKLESFPKEDPRITTADRKNETLKGGFTAVKEVTEQSQINQNNELDNVFGANKNVMAQGWNTTVELKISHANT